MPISDLEVEALMRERQAELERPEVLQRELALKDRKPRGVSRLVAFWTRLSRQTDPQHLDPMSEELARAFILARR